QEYERYKQRYQQFWQGVFDPIAARLTVGPRVKVELCVLPFANGSLYATLRGALGEKPLPLPAARIAPSAVASLAAVAGRKAVAGFLRDRPGVAEALEADPTLTDLSWLGDRVSVHVCDDDAVIEVDPLRLRPLSNTPVPVGVGPQLAAAGVLLAANLPMYVSVDVEDRDKAARLLDQLATRVFLKKGDLFGLPTALDAYRLPDYQGDAITLLSSQLSAGKVRLHVALVGNHPVAATKTRTLREVIDAAAAAEAVPATAAHLLLRLNRRGLGRLRDDLQLYWEEKARLACHHNILSI